MNPKRLLHLFLIIIISIANAQIPDNIQRYRNEPKGEIKNRKKGLLDGNRVRTQFFNTGEVSDWYNGAVSAPHLEWPKGTGHRHLDGYTFLVGSKFKIIDANNIERYITPIETQYREEMDRDPATGLIWGFEPLPGYVNPSSSTPAMSNNKESFPSVWPEALGLSPSWNGKWYSPYEGHTNDGMVETFYVMDDSRDKEFTKYPYNYFPVASDSDRGGLGLRVEVRATEFFWQPLQDVIFWDHTVANISDHDYDTTAFGLFIDPSVGSVMNDVDVNYPLSLTYFWAPSGKGLPDNFATGYLGIGVLASPNGNDSSNIASVRVNPLADKTQASVWPKNDLPMWLAMTGEFGDTTIINGNTSTVIGSNIFSFPKWSIAKYVVAMILGTDLPEIIMKKSIAKGAYDHSFILSDSIENTGTLKISVTSPIANSTLSGTVNVAWNVAGAAGKTISYIYCSKDNTEWSLIGIESAGTGTFNWNTTLFPDGIFNTLRVLTIAENGFGITENKIPLRVNNAVSAKPEIRFELPKPFTTLQGTMNLIWNGGDADGDPCVVNLYYRSYFQKAWIPIATNIATASGELSWDTRMVPNSLQFDYELKAEIISQTDTAFTLIEGLAIVNPSVLKPADPFITSWKSNGTGNIDIVIVDSTILTGHEYRITFESIPPYLSATVADINTGLQTLNGIFPLDNLHESGTFDGIRLRIVNDNLAIDAEHSGWVNNTSTFPMTPVFDYSNMAKNIRYPYDYQMTFSNVAVDTPILSGGPYIKSPVNFTIQNTTLQQKAYCLLMDMDKDAKLSVGDSIKIVDTYISPTNFKIVWNINYGEAGSIAPPPGLGDIYQITTRKPFAVGDTIIFTTQGLTGVNINKSIVPSDYFIHQNYPNPFNPSTTVRYGLPCASRVSIKVFNILGQQVAELVNAEQGAGWYETVWTSSLSTGLYIYRIDAVSTSDPAQKYSMIKKMLLLK